MNKNTFTNSPTENGYFWFWPPDASNSEPELLKVSVLRGEVREVDIVAGYSFLGAPRKLSGFTGIFKGPYRSLKGILVEAIESAHSL